MEEKSAKNLPTRALQSLPIMAVGEKKKLCSHVLIKQIQHPGHGFLLTCRPNAVVILEVEGSRQIFHKPY